MLFDNNRTSFWGLSMIININNVNWPSARYWVGVGLASTLLAGCGTPGESSDSSSSSSSSSVVSSSSSSSSSSTPVVEQGDPCIDGFNPHPTNGTISDGGVVHGEEEYGQADVSVDPVVYNYMYDNGWQDAHVLWHQARTCGGFGGAAGINGLPSACNFTELLPEQNDCEGDINGVDFFSGHRLMMEQLKELWPDHAEQFTGWDSFPRDPEDYPEELRPYFRGWSNEILEAAEIADNIANNLDMFPTEGALGTWMSCAIMPGSGGGGFGFGNGPDFSIDRNLHFGLHNNGVPTRNQKHAVNNNNNNIDAYLFWKLHGWIDKVWEEYRTAKGKTRADEDYKAEMLEQCREMERWREISVEARGEAGHPNREPDETGPGGGVERGVFAEVIQPALEEARCTTCHGAGEQANLRLGYQVTSREVVEGLVNRPSWNAAGYSLVVPGDPDRSWLYLKASGLSTSADVTCQATGACTQAMNGLTDQQIEVLRQWILDGAPAPTVGN